MLGLGVLRGLGVTLVEFFRPKTTVQYPEQRLPLAPGFRGAPLLVLDRERERARCVGCGICTRACPQGVISLRTSAMPDGSRKVLSYEIEIVRCLFCGLCEEACPYGAIKMSELFELASYNRYSLRYDEKCWEKATTQDTFETLAPKGELRSRRWKT